jgi:hypothetical protein
VFVGSKSFWLLPASFSLVFERVLVLSLVLLIQQALLFVSPAFIHHTIEKTTLGSTPYRFNITCNSNRKPIPFNLMLSLLHYQNIAMEKLRSTRNWLKGHLTRSRQGSDSSDSRKISIVCLRLFSHLFSSSQLTPSFLRPYPTTTS